MYPYYRGETLVVPELKYPGYRREKIERSNLVRVRGKIFLTQSIEFNPPPIESAPIPVRHIGIFWKRELLFSLRLAQSILIWSGGSCQLVWPGFLFDERGIK